MSNEYDSSNLNWYSYLLKFLLAGYSLSLSIISNSKKDDEEILITNGKGMPKGRNVLLKHHKGEK